ncbi:MAG TPA: ATP phosphoribosyltransferase regulatory subunit [Rubrobacteraceae bacterium]|nr:ATP phosphoribosyltransferase regulatory subunit [Rubrobacteraceae bacterium]
MKRVTHRKFATTPGTRDILPPESTRLRDVQTRIRERFRLFGYGEVLTPTLEYYEAIEEPKLRDASFKLFDPDNQMVMLRPEMTTPIARLVAQRLRNFPPPHKLSYVLPVYRRASVGRGQSAELYQAGVEVVGSPSPQEDAATIALLVDVLNSLGLEAMGDFAVVLGQTAFYAAYLHHAAPKAAPALLEALAAKDLVRVDALAADLADGVSAAVRRIPRLVGQAAEEGVLEEAEKLAGSVPEATAALDNLREILHHLDAHGCLEAVILDLGLIGRHNYYTGAVFEAYSPRLGFTVANGGRYDNLLIRFGQELPATGFAIYLERLLSVLSEEEADPLLILVGEGVEVTKAAVSLRRNGVPTLHLSEDLEPEAAAAYASSVEASWVCYPASEGVKLAPAEPDARFEALPIEDVAARVFQGAPRGAYR